MQNTTPDLAALIGSRICHDLISPIGAINNGLELLGMSGDASGPELSLITESVENASARIRFFRLAFGAASEQPVSTQDCQSVLRDMTRSGKLRVDWTLDGPATRADVRIAFLAEQCLETAMPYGGQITISKESDGWLVYGIADKFKVDDALWSVLGDGQVASDLAPAHVHFVLLAVHSRTEGRALRSSITDGDISIRF